MEVIKYWWRNIKEGYKIFLKIFGWEGYVFDAVIALVCSFILGNNFFEGVVIFILAIIIVFLVFGLFYSVICHPYYEYNDLQSKVAKISPDKLNISVDSSPFTGDVGEQGVYLYVINHEKRKILDLRAKKISLCQRDASTDIDFRGNEFGFGFSEFRFSWSNGLDLTELLPGDQEELEIAKIIDSQEIYPEFGIQHSKPPNTDRPSIYDVEIRFIGKLDGETSYSLFDYRGEILFVPISFWSTFEFIEHLRDVPEELRDQVYFSE